MSASSSSDDDGTIGAFLDSVKAGFAGRFIGAFEKLGIEDKVDLLDVDDEIFEDLRTELQAAGGKKLHIKKIEAAVRAVVQPAASTRAKLEEARALDAAIAKTSSQCLEQQSTTVADWVARSTKKFMGFLSHHKADCAMEARYLKEELGKQLGNSAKCFLDSDDLRDLRELLQHVKDSEVLVLLQSREVLLRPWCLLELHTAIAERIPIVAINVLGKGYDFAEMAQLCAHIDSKLDELNPGALELIQHHGVDPARLAYELSSVLPNVISVPFNASASANAIKASVLDTVDLMATAKRPEPIAISFADFVATRGKAPAPRREHGSGVFAAPELRPERSTSTALGAAPPPRECPPLPPGYQVRASIMFSIKTKLLLGAGEGGVSIIGMGGSGKTVVGSALMRDQDVRAAFDKLAFLPIGQAPVVRDLLALAHRQLTGERLDSKLTEEKALEKLREIASGSRVLLLIDDAWEPAQVAALNFLPEAQSTSRLVVTTRIHELVPGATEFELGLLDPDTAAALILEVAGERGAVQPPYPTLLLEAAEACGRLALVCALAGGILEAHGGEVDADFVGLLKEDHCEVLREGEHGDENVAIEDRLITNSLRTFKGKDRERAEALFKLMGCFPEDVSVPAAVLDVMAPTLVDESTKRPELKVRSSATVLLRCGLLRGSMGAGLLMHDIVRHHAIAMHTEEELRAKQRIVVKRLIASLGGRKAQLDSQKHGVAWYLRHHLWWNVRCACCAMDGGHEAVDKDYLAPLLRERKSFAASAAVLAVGKERSRAYAERLASDGRVRDAATWFDAVLLLGDLGLLLRSERLELATRIDQLIESLDANELEPLLRVAGVRAFTILYFMLVRMPHARLNYVLPWPHGGHFWRCVRRVRSSVIPPLSDFGRALSARVGTRDQHSNPLAAVCAKYGQLSPKRIIGKSEAGAREYAVTKWLGFRGITEEELARLQVATDATWVWGTKMAFSTIRFVSYLEFVRKYCGDPDALAPAFFADEASLLAQFDAFDENVNDAISTICAIPNYVHTFGCSAYYVLARYLHVQGAQTWLRKLSHGLSIARRAAGTLPEFYQSALIAISLPTIGLVNAFLGQPGETTKALNEFGMAHILEEPSKVMNDDIQRVWNTLIARSQYLEGLSDVEHHQIMSLSFLRVILEATPVAQRPHVSDVPLPSPGSFGHIKTGLMAFYTENYMFFIWGNLVAVCELLGDDARPVFVRAIKQGYRLLTLPRNCTGRPSTHSARLCGMVNTFSWPSVILPLGASRGGAATQRRRAYASRARASWRCASRTASWPCAQVKSSAVMRVRQ